MGNRDFRLKHRMLRLLLSMCYPRNAFVPLVLPNRNDETWRYDNLNRDYLYHLLIESDQNLCSTIFDLCSILHCLKIDLELKKKLLFTL